MTIERQELHCHNCDKYVQFDLDTELNGEHVLTCPDCGHLHYRYVNNGEISDRRWGQDPSQAAQAYQSYSVVSTTVTSSTTSVTISSSSSSTYLSDMWINTTSTGSTGSW